MLDGVWEANLASLSQFKGNNPIKNFQQNGSDTESVEGRLFAMMAAQVLDVLWIRSSFSLVFFVVAASGANSGMSTALLLVLQRVCCIYSRTIVGLG